MTRRRQARNQAAADDPVERAAARYHRRQNAVAIGLHLLLLGPVLAWATTSAALWLSGSRAWAWWYVAFGLALVAVAGHTALWSPRGTAWRQDLPVSDPVDGLAYHGMDVLETMVHDGSMDPLSAATAAAHQAARRLAQSTPPGSSVHDTATALARLYLDHTVDVLARGGRKGAPDLTDTIAATHRLVSGLLADRHR